MRTVKTASAVALLFAASSAMADSQAHRLKGDFAFSGTGVCLSSQAIFTPTSYTPPSGFDANLVAIGPAAIITFSVQGVRTFNGDGTGSSVGRVVALFVGGQSSASSSDQEIQFTYDVAADGTVTIDQSPTHNVFVSGSRTGQQTRVSNIPAFVGRLSSDRKSISFASVNTGVETVTRLLPDGSEPVEALRICHRERTAFRIGREDD